MPSGSPAFAKKAAPYVFMVPAEPGDFATSRFFLAHAEKVAFHRPKKHVNPFGATVRLNNDAAGLQWLASLPVSVPPAEAAVQGLIRPTFC